MSPRKAILLPLLSLLLAGLSPLPAPAGPPVREADLPVFPGSSRDAAAEASGEVRSYYLWKGVSDGSEWIRVYRTEAKAEKVFEFYRKELAAEEGDGGVLDLPSLPRGTVTPPVYGLAREGKGLARAGFSWVVVDGKAEITGFRIGVESVEGGTRIVLFRERLAVGREDR